LRQHIESAGCQAEAALNDGAGSDLLGHIR
jgi:hypothetical protein